jgi:hypothetical protein
MMSRLPMMARLAVANCWLCAKNAARTPSHARHQPHLPARL